MADSLVSNQQQVAELVDKLTLEDQPKDIDAVTGAADEELKVAVPDGAAAKDTKSQLDATEHRPFYPSNNYNGYYYLGPEGNGKEWEEQTRFPTPDNLDMQYPGVPSDNGSVVYYTSGFGYPQNPYNPYNPYIPGAPMMGGDAPYMGQRPPFFPGPYQQSPANGFFPPPMQPGRQENGSMPNGKANGNHVNKGTNKAGFKDGLKGPQSGSQLPKNFRPMSQIQLNQQQHGNGNSSAFSLKEHSQYRKFAPGFNQGKTMLPYANGNGMPFKPNIRPRGKFYGYHGNENWNFDGLNEQNRGPRINRPKGYQNGVDGKTNGDVPANKGEYNLENFAVNYETAKFFVIKSYSEDDVHQSIKYSVWASTPNGNKKLDGAYQEAQKASTDDQNECPIFLFFSVNASGQFCGVAQMTGNVDFNKSMDFWQQDKWNGFFPVKWHMIKDIPNSQFRQIILENNDNKPVTNSRDTQEIKFQQGIEMLKIFKSFAHKTSILDDFTFYEGRQKAMKEKKLKQKAVQQQLVAKGGAAPVGVENGIKNSELISESLNGCKGESILSSEKKEGSPVQGLSLATNDSEPQVENPRVFIVGSVAC